MCYDEEYENGGEKALVVPTFQCGTIFGFLLIFLLQGIGLKNSNNPNASMATKERCYCKVARGAPAMVVVVDDEGLVTRWESALRAAFAVVEGFSGGGGCRFGPTLLSPAVMEHSASPAQ